MNDTLSDAIREAYASAPAGVVVYHTLEIKQDGVQDSIYLVQGRQPIEASDEEGYVRTFSPSSFQFTLPPSDGEGLQALTVTIDNVNRAASDFLKAAMESQVVVELVYRPYLSTDLTNAAMSPPLRLTLKDASISTTQVVGRATFMDLVNRKFPSELYTRARFPTIG